jgi:CHAT domain-containing protein/Tfp pilus assembly protein PilF
VADRLADASLEVAIARAESVYLRASFDTAREALQRALATARETRDSINEGRVLTLLGLTAWRTADFSQARSLGEQALALKVRLGRGIELSKSYNALGLLAWDEGRLSDATTLLEQAQETAIAEGDSSTSAKAANNIGLVLGEQGKLAEARAKFVEARTIAARRGDARIEGGALTNLGMSDVQLGDPASAVAKLTRALELYRSISYATGEQNALAQLATAYEALGEPRLAFAAADTALELARKHGLRQEEAANIELAASLYRHAGDAHRALALYERGRALHKAMGATVDEGRSLRDAAEVQASLGRRDLASQFAILALGLHARAGAKLEALRDHLLLADLASLAGARIEAAGHLDTAGIAANSLGVRPGRVEVALTRATIADRDRDGRAVLRALASVRSDLERGGYGTEWREASLRARAFAARGQLDSAVAAGRSAVAAVERLRARFGSRFFRSTYAADKAETYGDLVDVLLRLGRMDEAFETADAARSRALIENLGAVESDSGLPGSVRALADRDALLGRIDQLAAKLDTLDETPPAERDGEARVKAAGLAALLAESRSAYEALLVRASEREADGTAVLGSTGARAADIQRALRPREAVVEYLATPSRVLAFVVTPDRVGQVSAEVPREQLVRQARIARDLMGRRDGTNRPSDDVLVSLHDVLIAPAERAGLLGGARRLVIVPHAFMSYLPFAALRQAGGRYLVEDYAILEAPSAAAFAAMRRARPSHAAPASLGDRSTGFAPFPDALPASARELRAFRQTVPTAGGVSGSRATELRLREALRSPGAVHIATHGQMNPRNPMFSRIELARGSGRSAADDGRLEVHEILGLHVAAGLVFLSGCETAVGPAWSTEFDRGEDYASLAQAFLFAGARTVVATLWPIADDGAAEFATRFYAHLAKESPPEALAAAQREMLASGSRSAPYYWAAYQVSGDGESAGFRTPRAIGP